MIMIKKTAISYRGLSVFKKVCTTKLFSAGPAPCKEPGTRRQEVAGASGGLSGQLSWPGQPKAVAQPRHVSRSSLLSPTSLLDPGCFPIFAGAFLWLGTHSSDKSNGCSGSLGGQGTWAPNVICPVTETRCCEGTEAKRKIS